MAEKVLLSVKNDGLNFGDYTLPEKTKQDGFSWNGDIYKVKTFREITKLEKNGSFAYESEPGTAVVGYAESASGMTFQVKGEATAQITVGLEEDCEYDVFLDDVQIDRLQTGISGKLSINVELNGQTRTVKIVKG